MAKVVGGGGGPTKKPFGASSHKVAKNLSPSAQRQRIMSSAAKPKPKGGGGITGFKAPSAADAAKSRKALGQYWPKK